MTVEPQISKHYAGIVERVMLAGDPLAAEQALAEAFELGRALVGNDATPDDIATLHHLAVLRLAGSHPGLALGDVADRLNQPLLELTMAHGMAFREQEERQAMMAARLEQSARLEALGTLAAGIAHDFNNLLGSIVGYAEMTEDAIAAAGPGRENLRQILIACGRARHLVERMLAFARQKPIHPVARNLAGEVAETLAMLEPGLGEGIRLEFDNALPEVEVLADPGQLQQVVMNLCLNAAEAMEGRGHIRIGLAPAASGDGTPKGRGGDARLRVADNGPGMPPEVRERAFDPFFTTKAPKGSGLGLSITHGIVTQLGGEIVIASRTAGPNTGTEIDVYLPHATGPETDARAPRGE
ncbi:MAG: histidine kinase [Deltaproteobacteria bacterium]|nr:histidine kinase [Candidatus Anaeroferrophillacea bacterium]